MKSFAIISVLAIAATLFIGYNNYSATSDYDMFLARYGKSYNSVDEYEFRKALFDNAQKFIDEENAKGHSYTLAMNEFGDWTDEEYNRMLGFKGESHSKHPENPLNSVEDNKKTIDWQAEGVVSEVKNQGSCGSCWAFSAVGALEAAHAIHGDGEVQQYAEQQLVDCDKACNGCNGGEMYDAFAYYESVGACHEKNYPYVAYDQCCDAELCDDDSSPISSHELHLNNSPAFIRKQLVYGPHSLGVAAGNDAFRYYSSGELDDPNACGDRLDHGVLLVGYIAERKAWKVKNSWGPKWGEAGYIYIKDVPSSKSGVCGVNLEISRPII